MWGSLHCWPIIFPVVLVLQTCKLPVGAGVVLVVVNVPVGVVVVVKSKSGVDGVVVGGADK